MIQSQPFIDSLNVTRKLEQKLAEIEPSLAILESLCTTTFLDLQIL